jgi:hypothetical protein
MPRATGLPGGPRRHASAAVSVPTYRGPSSSNEARRNAIEKLLSLVAQRLSPYKFSFWIDERHVFCICSLDGRPSAFRVPLGKDLVQVAVKQLLCVWHAIDPLIVIRRAFSVAGVGRVMLGAGGLEPVAAHVQVLSDICLEREPGVVGLHDFSPLHVLDLETRLDIGVGPEV